MAVVSLYGSLVMAGIHKDNVAIQALPDVTVNGGRVRLAMDLVESASGDSIASKYFFARLPSHVVILPQSVFHFDDLGTSVTLDIGDVNDPNGLATLVDVAAAAGSSPLLEAVDIANYGKTLWELLGYSTDPKSQIDLYATVQGAASSGGTLVFVVFYTED